MSDPRDLNQNAAVHMKSREEAGSPRHLGQKSRVGWKSEQGASAISGWVSDFASKGTQGSCSHTHTLSTLVCTLVSSDCVWCESGPTWDACSHAFSRSAGSCQVHMVQSTLVCVC